MSVTYKGKKFKVKKVKNDGLELDLCKKKIENIDLIDGLENLTDLIILDLSENKITKILDLSPLVNLQRLYLARNQITEIKGLENLVNLRKLDLEGNQISEIKGLEHLVNLSELNLKRNHIPEIKGLDNLKNLKVLELSVNKISELKGLENLVNLNKLIMFNNPVYEWIMREIGTHQLAKIAVRYCARKTGKEIFRLDEVEKFLKVQQQEISNLIQKKNYDKTIKLLQEVYDEVKLDDAKLFYKFFGELVWKYPHLFEEKKFTRYYLSEIDYIFTPKQALKMEAYIIDNYCTYQGEEVLTSFYGQLYEKIYGKTMVYDGRIHITSYRIFVFGSKEELPQGVFVFRRSLIGALISSLIHRHIKIKGAKLLSKYGGQEEVPSFGFQYPIINAEKTARNNNIVITCHLENKKTDVYQRRHIEDVKFNMALYPRPLKDETPEEMVERMKYIASLIQYNQTTELFEL